MNETLTRQELIAAANRGDPIAALPGWTWNATCKCWDHDERYSSVALQHDGSWMLSMSDGLYYWTVANALEGMEEELLP